MTATLIQDVEASQLKTDLPHIEVGDTVDVHVRIVEGAKERVQVFTGVVMKVQGRGLTRTMTVRRIVANEGVERTFPIHSPKVSKIEVKRHGHTRRSRLYFLRDRVGKARRLPDRKRGLHYLEPIAVIASKGKKKKKGAPADEADVIEAEGGVDGSLTDSQDPQDLGDGAGSDDQS